MIRLIGPQKGFVESDAHVVGFLADRGAGKTAAGAMKAARKILQGESGLIVAPNFPRLTVATFPEFMKWAPTELLLHSNIDHPYTPQHVMQFNVRGKTVSVYYGSVKNIDSFRGLAGVSWLWLDEVDGVTGRDFEILRNRILRCRDADTQAWITAVDPREEKHWLNRYFLRGLLPEGKTDRKLCFGDRPYSDCFPVLEQYNLVHASPEQRALVMELYPALCQGV